jgi:DNA mismatch endonuclease (patch repair protein)
MARIGPKNTKPELIVRRLLHAMGRRFRLHRRDLPGTPDIVLPGLRKALFVHGCFWHRHPGCSKATMPKTRQAFWLGKFERNVERDHRKEEELNAAGWDVLTVWECETRNLALLEKRLRTWLDKA